MSLVIALVVCLMPLLIAPGLLFHFSTVPKLGVLLAGTSVLLLFFRRNAENLQRVWANRLGRIFIMLATCQWVSLAISTLLSSDQPLSIFGSTWRGFGLLAWSVLLIFVVLAAGWLSECRSNCVLMLWTIAIGGAIGSIYGISQYLGWDPLIPRHAYQAGEGPFTIVRPPGTLGHADYFAAWLSMAVFCDLALFAVEPVRSRRWFSVVAACLGTIAIVLSGTRSAMFGLAAGVVYWLVALKVRPSRYSIGLGFAAVAMAGVFIVSPLGGPLRARFHWSMEDRWGGARPLLWRDSLRMIARRPVFGHGPEVFVLEFPKSESLELAKTYPDFYHESPHNIFLDALAAQGVVGVAILGAFCGLFLYAARLNTKADPAVTALAAGFVATVVCHQFIVFLPVTALYFFLLTALLMGLSQLDSDSRTVPAVASKWFLVPVQVIPAIAFTVCAVRLVASDYALARMQSMADAGNVSAAAAQYRDTLRWQLPGPGSDLDYSRKMASLTTRAPDRQVQAAALQESIAAAVRATAHSEDRQNAWYNLAMLQATQNDAGGVEYSLRKAISCSPVWFKPHWALAQLLEMTHRHAEALSESALAVEEDGKKDAEVLATWQRLNSALK